MRRTATAQSGRRAARAARSGRLLKSLGDRPTRWPTRFSGRKSQCSSPQVLLGDAHHKASDSAITPERPPRRFAYRPFPPIKSSPIPPKNRLLSSSSLSPPPPYGRDDPLNLTPRPRPQRARPRRTAATPPLSHSWHLVRSVRPRRGRGRNGGRFVPVRAADRRLRVPDRPHQGEPCPALSDTRLRSRR